MAKEQVVKKPKATVEIEKKMRKLYVGVEEGSDRSVQPCILLGER